MSSQIIHINTHKQLVPTSSKYGLLFLEHVMFAPVHPAVIGYLLVNRLAGLVSGKRVGKACVKLLGTAAHFVGNYVRKYKENVKLR